MSEWILKINSAYADTRHTHKTRQRIPCGRARGKSVRWGAFAGSGPGPGRATVRPVNEDHINEDHVTVLAWLS